MRLDRFLANSGIGSRSEVKKFIKKGLVSVNDIVCKNSEYNVSLDDLITYMGNQVSLEQYLYIMFHKPAGCVSATQDNLNTTVMDYLKNVNRSDLFPVGRLDKDTEGLLLITNDGNLAHRLLSPKKHIDKTYYVKIDGIMSEREIAEFEEGLDIKDEKKTLPAKLEFITLGEVSEAIVTIWEGRFHQIKRMFQVSGKSVLYLKRISMGTLLLDETLEKGCYRYLTEAELKELKNA